jgi:hypothetical protein
MNAIIKLDQDFHLFNTKEEWNSYKDRLNHRYVHVLSDPEKFPCLSIKTHYEFNNAGSRDYQHHYFFYDFILENEEGRVNNVR